METEKEWKVGDSCYVKGFPKTVFTIAFIDNEQIYVTYLNNNGYIKRIVVSILSLCENDKGKINK